MFITFGERRINISLVREYKPISKNSIDKSYYLIQFRFLDGSTDEIHFFEREEDRNEYLKYLDKNFLTSKS